jgi:hypothetical protein
MGSMTGLAPQMDTMNFGFAPGQMSNPGPSLNPIPFPGAFPATPAAMGMNPNSWNDDMTAMPTTGSTSINTDFGSMQGFGTMSSGMDGMGMGMGTMASMTSTGAPAEGENSDDYWNALIDGASGNLSSSSITHQAPTQARLAIPQRALMNRYTWDDRRWISFKLNGSEATLGHSILISTLIIPHKKRF